MVRFFSDAHNMGSICKQAIKCVHCGHRKSIAYSKGTLFCWHCKRSRALTQQECDEINQENKVTA